MYGEQGPSLSTKCPCQVPRSPSTPGCCFPYILKQTRVFHSKLHGCTWGRHELAAWRINIQKIQSK